MKIDITQCPRSVTSLVRVPKVIRLATLLFAYLLVNGQAMAQTQTVTGRVTDAETGTGLPGVTVLLKGTTTAAPTGVDGSYTLTFRTAPVPSSSPT